MSDLWRCADSLCTKCCIVDIAIVDCATVDNIDDCETTGKWECRDDDN